MSPRRAAAAIVSAAAAASPRAEAHDPLLPDRAAAKYLGRSASWIRAKRAARLRGATDTTPAHIVIGKSVFYRLSALNAYIAANAVQDGRVEFANRGRASRARADQVVVTDEDGRAG